MKNFQSKALSGSIPENKLRIPAVSEFMTPVGRLITIKESSPVMAALGLLLDKSITGVPVLNDEGSVVGMLDDKDCLNILLGGAYYNHPVERDTVSEYMSDIMKSITIDTDIVNVANIFLTTPFKRLLVMDQDSKLAGQISRGDVLKAIKDMKNW